jgi:type II secretory pathway pseudopilin PulG
MQNTKRDFTLTECLIVVAIIFFAAVIGIHNALLSLTASEEQTVKAAAVEYAAVRNMYAGPNRTIPSVDGGAGSNAGAVPNLPIH